jgi:hypothetical protein
MSEEKNVILSKDKKPDAGSQSVDEYINVRYEMVKPALDLLGASIPGSSVDGYLILMLREEFWRSRSAVMENSLVEFVRRYLAAVEVIKHLSEDGAVNERIIEALKTVPEEITKLPVLE